ncbi:MAG: hypothetical protein ACRERC_06030 [Candidatus Binatia bacterium]
MGKRDLMTLVAAGALLIAAPGRAEVSVDAPASILVFPRVVADGTRDTIIQVTNSGNGTVYALCWYEAAPSGLPSDDECLAVDFTLALTKQQPTSWVVSSGRPSDPSDTPCSNHPPDYDCAGAGFDPGRVPPASAPFDGTLRCIETDATGAPLSGNHLTGEATLEDVTTGDVSKYDAIGLRGLEANDGDATLRIGEEYADCPELLLFDHAAAGAPMESVPSARLDTDLTVVQCAADLRTQLASNRLLQILVTSEFESRYSTSVPLGCRATSRLGDLNQIFTVAVTGSRTVQTRIRATLDNRGGLLGIAEEVRSAGPARAVAATTLHGAGEIGAVDLVQLP